MSIDKDLYRQAREWYRQMNDAELTERVRNAGKLSSQENYQLFVDLWEFAKKSKMPVGQWQIQEKIDSLERYYSRLKKMEAWREKHGRTSEPGNS